MIFGDLNPNQEIASLHGDIQMFLLFKAFSMDEIRIKAHHKMICERFHIDHDAIYFS